MADRYLSPTGNDAAAGTLAAPWKTFTWAVTDVGNANRIVAGDTLWLLDGEYTAGTSGIPHFDNTAGAPNGAVGAPITMKALNERQAYIHPSGPAETWPYFRVTYWIFEGLRIGLDNGEIDFTSTTAYTNTARAQWDRCHNFVVRRCLFHRCAYGMFIYPGASLDGLIEDNEVYWFQEAAYKCVDSRRITFRRNYAHKRHFLHYNNTFTNPAGRYWDIYPSDPSTDILLENNICEGYASEAYREGAGFQNSASQHSSNPPDCTDITLVGNILFNCRPTHIGEFRSLPDNIDTSLGSHLVQRLTIRNHLHVINNSTLDGVTGHDVWAPASTALYENMSLIYCGVAPRTTALQGFRGINGNCGETGPGVILGTAGGVTTRGYTLRNLSVYGFTGGPGFAMDAESQAWESWSADHMNSNGNQTNFSPASHANMTNLTTDAPGAAWLACPVWVPDASPLSGSGSTTGGTGKGYTKTSGTGASADKGATILYAYVDGALTETKLWSPTTGAWTSAGVVVAGINDVTGESLFDVHDRLGISAATLPASYTGVSADFPDAPLVDDFAGTGALSASWTTLSGNGWSRVAGDATPISGFSNIAYVPMLAQHQQTWITVAGLPADGTGVGLYLNFYLQDTLNRYRAAVFVRTSLSLPDRMVLDRVSGGSISTLSTVDLANRIAVGDGLGVDATASTITILYRRSGVWEVLTEVVPPTTPPSSSRIGLGADVATVSELGAGWPEATVGAIPTANPTIMVVNLSRY